MEKTIKKHRLGGLKIVEEGACVASSFPDAASCLDVDLCAPLAQKKINLTFLTYVAGAEPGSSDVVFCTDLADGAGSHTLVQSRSSSGQCRFLAPTCIISVYPHDQRPEVPGFFLRSLSCAQVRLQGLASSPAAISGVLLASDKDRAVQQLFQQFRFPSYQSPAEFYAAQLPPQELVRAVVAAYQEKVIKVYCLVQEVDLDLWDLNIPSPGTLGDFGRALAALGKGGFRLPFLVALPTLASRELRCTFALAAPFPAEERAGKAEQVLRSHLPDLRTRLQSPVAAIFVHGPHFGDRYGICHTLLAALNRVGVNPVALSCAVSSISVMMKQENLTQAVATLEATFEVPRCQPVQNRGRDNG
ncbi:MAG: hypothetical protein ACUVXF_00070 [Desulfobaccales bacterium]